MSGINKIVLLGTVCSVPELILSELLALHFEVEIAEEIAKGGIKVQHIEVVQIILQGWQAQKAGTSIKNNDLVCVQGKIKTAHDLDVSEFKRYTTCVIASHFELIT
jgi:hypothetical protein